MRSNPAHQLYIILFAPTILHSDLNSSTSNGHLADLKTLLRLFFKSFIWLGEKNSSNFLLISRGTFVQTMSTSFMSKLVKYFLFVLWSYLDDNLFLGFSCRSFGQELLFCSFVLYIFRQLLLDDFLVNLVRLIFDISNQFFV